MGDIINKNMTIKEIKKILNDNGIATLYGWEIILMSLFNTYNTDTAEIIGFGSNAEFEFKESQ